MIKIIAVKYLNTLPFVHGIEESGILKDYLLELDIPSSCAKKLEKREADIGLVPIAALDKLKDYHVFSDYCIGATNSVASVLLVGDKPIEELTEIYLDYQSNTTNLLIKIICNKYLNIYPVWKKGMEGFEDNISGSTGGIIIGDRAFYFREKFKYKYDLASLWNKYTDLPFVFACWVAKEEVQNSILDDFNAALAWGVQHKHDAIKDTHIDIDLEHYFDKSISYDFNSKKKQAMDLYLSEIRSLNPAEPTR